MRLREARKAAGYTQQKLANAVGVSRSTVAMWESGTDCGTEMAARLSALLGVSTDYLLERTEDSDNNAGAESPEIQMTEAEYALSMRWRKLSDKGKRDVMNFIQYTETMEQDGNEEE